MATYPGKPGIGAGGVDDLHVEAARPLCHGPADAPVADHAQGRPVHVVGEVTAETPAVPAAVAQIVFGGAGVPGGGQDQEEGEVGRRGIEDPGCIADRDAQFVRDGHVDVVEPHGGVGHHAQPARPTGPEHGAIDLVAQVADDAVAVRRPGLQLGWGRCHVVVRGDDLVPRVAQRIGATGDQGTRDQDPGHAQWVV